MTNIVIFTFNDTSEWKSDFNIYKPHSGVETLLMILIMKAIKLSQF